MKRRRLSNVVPFPIDGPRRAPLAIADDALTRAWCNELAEQIVGIFEDTRIAYTDYVALLDRAQRRPRSLTVRELAELLRAAGNRPKPGYNPRREPKR